MVKVLEIRLVLLPIFTTLIAQGFDYVHNLDYLYPTYQLIDTAVRNDQKLMFKMKQAFFPAMNFRFWQVDGAEVIPIDVCVTFHKSIAQLPPNQDNPINTGDNLVRDFEQCWSFLWTNSLLLNLIPGDILMAMDPSLTAIFYSGIVGSYMHRGLTMRLSLHLNGSHSLDDYEQGFALFLCLSRAEISSSQLEPRYHGYIARRYTYYNSDPYFSRLVSSKIAIAKSLLGLWGTFLFLNLLIPLLSITRRKQVIQWLTKATAASNPRLYRAIVLVLFLFNIIYILSVVVLHSVNGYPTATNCHISWSRERCRVPPTSTSYKHIFAILITKAITLPIALLIELAVAVYSVIKDSYLRPRIKQCIQIMVTWQLLIFVHITMGLISIPFLVLAFISPATVLLSTAGIVLVLLLIIFIFTFSPIPKRCNFTVLLQSCLSMVEILLIVAFVFSAFITYYTIVKDGLNMSGVKGYITSLIPTIVISLFVWMLRKGFLGKQLNSMKGKRKKTERHRTKSFSSETEDETINLLSTTSN